MDETKCNLDQIYPSTCIQRAVNQGISIIHNIETHAISFPIVDCEKPIKRKFTGFHSVDPKLF